MAMLTELARQVQAGQTDLMTVTVTGAAVTVTVTAPGTLTGLITAGGEGLLPAGLIAATELTGLEAGGAATVVCLVVEDETAAGGLLPEPLEVPAEPTF